MSEKTDPVNGTDSDAASSRAPIAAIVAPALAFGATIVAKKVLASAYRAVSGNEAPSGRDREASLGSVLAWAAISAASAAVIEVAIYRATARLLDD